MGIGLQYLFKKPGQEYQLGGKAKVFLGNLELHHQRGFRHSAEHRMKGFPGLEIYGSVLYLYQDILQKLSVVWHEFGIGLHGPVCKIVLRIHKGPPHDNAFIGGDGFRKHIGAIYVVPAIILRPGLPFGIGFYEEPSKIRDEAVNFLRLVPPPLPYPCIQRIGCVEPADLHRGRKPGGQVNLNVIRPEHIGQGLYFFQIREGKDFGIRIDIGEGSTINANRGIGPGIVDISLVYILRQGMPVPDGEPRIAALNASVEVVPVVQHTDVRFGAAGGIEARKGLLHLQ